MSEPAASSDASLKEDLCIRCLASNFPHSHFCEKCGAPLDSYAATAPYERIYAEGHAFRSAVTGRPKLIVVIGIWLLFLPGMIAAIFALYSLRSGGGMLFASVVAMGIYGAISSALIYKTTRNYLRRQAPAREYMETRDHST